MTITRDFELLIGLVVLIAGVAAALVIRGFLVRLLVLAAAVLIAAYFLGLLPPLPFVGSR